MVELNTSMMAATHPGEFLKEELEVRGIELSRLAKEIGIDSSALVS